MLTVTRGGPQAFCANSWCVPEAGAATCRCPVFSGVGLAPALSSSASGVVSTYDILAGAAQARELPPSSCHGAYVDCYGKPCKTDPDDQGSVLCACEVREGSFNTMAQSCGPSAQGLLPNGSPAPPVTSGAATVHDIMSLLAQAP